MTIDLFVYSLIIAIVGGVVAVYFFRAEKKAGDFIGRLHRTPDGGMRRIRAKGGRHEVELRLHLDEHIVDLPLRPRVLIVREGPDTNELLNETQEFDGGPIEYTTLLSYPTASGLQFKCFVDWIGAEEAPPTLLRMQKLLEQNGWDDVTPDGLHKGRFWFIVPEFATKYTEDTNRYINNWLPAGPKM